jgi:hypothetical protein
MTLHIHDVHKRAFDLGTCLVKSLHPMRDQQGNHNLALSRELGRENRKSPDMAYIFVVRVSLIDTLILKYKVRLTPHRRGAEDDMRKRGVGRH